MSEDIIRVIRIYEFIGNRKAVEEQLIRSVQGQRDSHVYNRENKGELLGRVIIRATTLGTFPEILQENQLPDEDLLVGVVPYHYAQAGNFSIIHFIDKDGKVIKELPPGQHKIKLQIQ